MEDLSGIVSRALAAFRAASDAASLENAKARFLGKSGELTAAQAALKQWHKDKQLKELLEIRGPEIYLYYPDGVGRSKLTGAVIENKLDTPGTARNWNTLIKLIEAGRLLEANDGGRRIERREKGA